MIQLQDITKSFGTLQVLRGINLQIEKGEVVAIVGPSGAGKTTLLQIMGTLDKPDTGKVLIQGKDVFRLSGSKLSKFRNEHIGFVFQFHQLLPEFTALENIMIPALIGGAGKGEARKRALELLEFMKLTERADHKPSELSGGEKQRTSPAVRLIHRIRKSFTVSSLSYATRWVRPLLLSPTMNRLQPWPTAPSTSATV